MKAILFVLSTLALAPAALAAPPAAPVVTVGVSGIKRLQFDWASIPNSSRYELWFRVAPGGQWAKLSETSGHGPLIRLNVSVHLLDWRTAQYRVAACNASGCTNSAPVGVHDLALDAVGYLKQNFDGEGRWYGQSVAMSADGMTAAVASAYAAGGNSLNGVVYVYRKTSASGGWHFEVRLMPNPFRESSSQPYTYNNALSLNADGTLIAFGRPEGGAGGTSFNGTVYLFRRNGTTWTQEKRLLGVRANDNFGKYVDLDDSGNTLAIWHRASSGAGYGVAEIYNHTSAGWQPTATIPNPAPPGGYADCQSQALSGDGKTLVRTCFIEGYPRVLVHKAPSWAESARIDAGNNEDIDTNFDGTLFVARRGLNFADVYRLQQNVWSPDSGSPLDFETNINKDSPLYTSIAMSRDGKYIAAGDADDDHGTVGPQYPPIPNAGTEALGSVYVWERKSAGWRLRRVMKPSVAAGRTTFGNAVGISGNGHNLIVGAVDDLSGATGIHGDPADTSEPHNQGAAWLY